MLMRLHPDVLLTDTDDGAVLLHQQTGRFWQLNRTGSRLLHRLLEGEAPEVIAADLAARHQVDPGQVTEDVRTVVTQLADAQLVTSS
ncbi:lasso peptide biosynthesis PqqD family chaperone [Pseudonocardia sp. RS010]|uniref:lasso peptide biosynthesis PqqD family chaperone n=1 Tax=Pseudonocardia sp. RS010 TaxID=3385979 RepID=UPI0039A2C87B